MNRLAIVQKFASVGDRQIRVRASDGSLDRSGDIVVASGCVADNYRKNPIVLFSHDPNIPIGKADVTVRPDCVDALITFAPANISKKADEICALAKAGVLNAVSIGFSPIEYEPLPATNGRKYTKWELLEISVVAVPANASALVVERSLRVKSGRSVSDANLGHINAIIRHANKIEECRVAAADLHDEVNEHLGEMRKWLERARQHAKALMTAGGVFADDDDASSSDSSDADEELSARIGRIKVLQDLMARGHEIERAKERFERTWEAIQIARNASVPTVPERFRKVDINRQVTAVISTGGDLGNVRLSLPDGDFSYFEKKGPVLWKHQGPAIAWCNEIKIVGDNLVATAQFPRAGVDRRADEIFNLISSGEVRGASVGFSFIKSEKQPTRDWYLREWSFCYNGADGGARVLTVGGRPFLRRWDDPAAPRMPTLDEMGPTPAHWAAAQRRYLDLWRNSHNRQQ
jgi:HK97 family phage prohead protease